MNMNTPTLPPPLTAGGDPVVGPVVIERARLCAGLDALLDAGATFAAAAAALRGRHAAGALPSDATLRRWHAAWRAGGTVRLADRRAGRQRKPYGWEARAIALWNQPQRPARATVAYWLRAEGWASATASRVRRYLRSLPATVGGEDTPRRAGRHWHRQNVTPHVVRDAGVLEVGFVYEGDGHLCKTYVQHPVSGRHWRPELTVWLDVRSHFCAGWWLSEAESAISTLYSLSKTLLRHDHVPAALHTDPGSGFTARLLTDEATGWLDRAGMSVIGGLPANPRGQGLVEGWWRWFEERCGKRFAAWCGRCRTDQALRHLEAKVRRGEIEIPTLAQYAAAVEAYVESYNHTPQRALGAAPAALWAGLERNPVELPEAALLRPAEPRVVQRGGVTLFNRLYRAPELALLEGRTVTVEYDLTDDARVWIVYARRRVCEACLVVRRPWAAASRIGDLRERRAAGRRRRLERKLAEVEAQARPVIDAHGVAETAAALAPSDAHGALGRDAGADFDPYDVLPPGETPA